PPKEAFNFQQHNANDKMSTQCDWSQFFHRLDFIIEFQGEFIFEELKAVVQELNKDQDSEMPQAFELQAGTSATIAISFIFN
ncbi:16608_t:CDS:2, partial [Dentiscutata heterogama]